MRASAERCMCTTPFIFLFCIDALISEIILDVRVSYFFFYYFLFNILGYRKIQLASKSLVHSYQGSTTAFLVRSWSSNMSIEQYQIRFLCWLYYFLVLRITKREREREISQKLAKVLSGTGPKISLYPLCLSFWVKRKFYGHDCLGFGKLQC